jgi:hypothetical protein
LRQIDEQYPKRQNQQKNNRSLEAWQKTKKKTALPALAEGRKQLPLVSCFFISRLRETKRTSLTLHQTTK